MNIGLSKIKDFMKRKISGGFLIVLMMENLDAMLAEVRGLKGVIS